MKFVNKNKHFLEVDGKKQSPSILYLINLIFSFGENLSSKVLPAYLSVIGLGAAPISIIQASYQIARGVSPLIIGTLLDKTNRKKTLMFSMLGISIIAFLLGNLTTPFALSILFFFAGFGTSIFYISLNSLITIVYSDGKVKALSYLEIVYQIGFVAGSFVAGYLAQSHGFFIVFALWSITLIVGSVVTLYLPNTSLDCSSKENIVFDFNTVFSQLRSYSLVFPIGIFLVGYIEGMRDLVLPILLVTKGFNLQDTGNVYALSAAITGVGVLILGPYFDKKNRVVGLELVYLIIILSLLSMLFLQEKIFLLAVVVGILSIGRSLGLAISRAHAGDATNVEHRSRGLSLYEMLFSAGKVAGALVSGMIFNTLSSTSSIIFSIVLVLLSLIFTKAKRF